MPEPGNQNSNETSTEPNTEPSTDGVDEAGDERSAPSQSGGPLRVVIFGGIGSGKSTVGRMLGEHGAVVIDADAVGHAVLEPGGAAHEAVATRWPEVVEKGRIDRGKLGRAVFADLDGLRQLEAITHPHIGDIIVTAAQKAAALPVVVELPLMRRILGPEWIWVLVDADDGERVRRVVARGSAPDDVARRMAAQPTRDQWRSSADLVLENEGDEEGLRRRVADLWSRLTGD